MRNFSASHWEHFLKNWYNALIVALKCCGCWCRLTTAFAVHINVTKIAIQPVHDISILWRRLGRASANVQTPKSLRCQHKRSWYLSHCPVTLSAQMCRLTRVFAAGVNSTHIAILGSTRDFVNWRRLRKAVQMCRLARAFAARTKWHSFAIWATTWEFLTVTKAQTRPNKCEDSPKLSLFARMTPKIRERSGSVVEFLTRDWRAAGSSLTGVTVLWSLSKTH